MWEDNRGKKRFTGERFISIIMDYIAPDCILARQFKVKTLKLWICFFFRKIHSGLFTDLFSSSFRMQIHSIE